MARKRAKKKHHGVKDPYKQMQERFNKIKDKVDRKPTNDQTQEIPRKLQEILDYQNNKLKRKQQDDPQLEEDKEFTKLKKRGKKLIDVSRLMDVKQHDRHMTRPLSIPRLIQKPNEPDNIFLRRVDAATKAILHESKFEDKFSVDVQRDSLGSVSELKRRKEEDNPTLYEKKRRKMEAKKEEKKEKRKERDARRKQKKKKKVKDDDEFKNLQDKVEFGEVAYEPPSLDTARFSKMAKGEVKAKAFLFMNKLNTSQAENASSNQTETKKKEFELERQRAVLAYRAMKAEKYKSFNKSLSYG